MFVAEVEGNIVGCFRRFFENRDERPYFDMSLEQTPSRRDFSGAMSSDESEGFSPKAL